MGVLETEKRNEWWRIRSVFLVLYGDHPLYHYQGISIYRSRTYLSVMIENIATERDASTASEEVRDAKGRSSSRTWKSYTEIVAG
jgi:hypothetical protein